MGIHGKRTICTSCLVPNETYKGDVNNDLLRNGYGRQQWERKDWRQESYGKFTNDCIHGLSTYKWKTDENVTTYEGRIYANDIEGYGLMSYGNGTTYEGLFKNNKRFGPGVFIYTDGSQNIGLWDCNRIVRLVTNVTKGRVPRLTETNEGKMKLLKYRKLVQIKDNCVDEAIKILKDIGADEDLLQQANELYSDVVRDPSSKFFNKTLYDSVFFEDFSITVIPIHKITSDLNTQVALYSFNSNTDEDDLEIVTVSHLVAWNNNDISTSILLHMFAHRNFENTLTFDICKLLRGEKPVDRKVGSYEQTCERWLNYCFENSEYSELVSFIYNQNVHPNVCDSNGNSAIMLAAINDNTNCIGNLAKLAVNFDYVNDEGLSALTVTLLRYLSELENVQCWEQSFLPYSTVQTDTSIIPSTSSYMFEIYPDHVQLKNKNVSIEKQTINNTKLIQIEDTITALLKYGADPDHCEVINPPLIIGIFTNNFNIIHQMLLHGANPNVTTTKDEGSLTALHLLTSMKAENEHLIDIITLLLQNGADPNIRADYNHWNGLKQEYMSDDFVENGSGKTPLHMISMKKDFADERNEMYCKFTELLLHSKANAKLRYLNHTPLNYAMIRGNVDLIKTMLGTRKVDPNHVLGEKYGVPLTFIFTEHCINPLSADLCCQILDIIVENGGNPLMQLNSNENVLDFATRLTRAPDKHNESITSKKVNKNNDLERKKDIVLDHLKNLVRVTLTKYYKTQLVLDIASQIQDGTVEHDLIHKAKILTVENVFEILKRRKEFDECLEKKQLQSLFQFVQKHGTRETKVVKKYDKGCETIEKPLTANEMVSNLYATKDTENKFFQIEFLFPEIDDDSDKYDICFECLRREGLTLLTCPTCEVVKFCSEECNLKNIRRADTTHKCKKSFYNKVAKELFGKGDEHVHEKKEKSAKNGTEKSKKSLERESKKKEKPIKEKVEKESLDKSEKGKDHKTKKDKPEIRDKSKTAADKKTKNMKKDKEDEAMTEEIEKSANTDEDNEENLKKGKTKTGKKDKKGKGSSRDKSKESQKNKDKQDKKDKDKDRKSKRSKSHEKKEKKKEKPISTAGAKLKDTEKPKSKFHDFMLQVCGSDESIQFDDLTMPYIAYMDGNFYYRVFGQRPLFVPTYSEV